VGVLDVLISGQQIANLLPVLIYDSLLKHHQPSRGKTAGRVPQTPYSFAGPKE
jgi:hypothetical protein